MIFSNARHDAKKGFTLLELAIVLVIVALIAAGIVVGRSVIREAQIQAALGEYDSYLKGIKEFQDKYSALPGDFGGSAHNATAMWGSMGTCPAVGASTGTLTCDGNGDGYIGTSVNGAPVNDGEWWLVWQHLSNAGFVTGTFTGAPGASGGADIGVNVPASKVSGAGWTLNYVQDNSVPTISWGHILNLGATAPGDYTRYPIFTGEEALEIDKKIDDGIPATGNVRANSAAANCTAAGAYNTANKNIVCSLIFLLGY